MEVTDRTDADNTLQGSITVNADNIELKVSLDDVINSINISTEGIKIDADNITLDGVVSVTDDIQASNYVATVSGWIIHGDGSAEFNNVTVRGKLGIIDEGDIRLGSGTVGVDFTGIRIYNDGATYRVAGINNDVLQAYLDSDGSLKSGAGNVVLDAEHGLTVYDKYCRFLSGEYEGYVWLGDGGAMGLYGDEFVFLGVDPISTKWLGFDGANFGPWEDIAIDLGGGYPFKTVYATDIDLAAGRGAIDGTNIAIEGSATVAITAPAGQLTLAGAACSQTQPANSLDTDYQNDSGKIRFVMVTVDPGAGESCQVAAYVENDAV